MILIGESLNANIARVGEAIHTQDEAFVRSLAQEQKAAGAHLLDANAATPGGNEVEDLVWLVKTAQSAVDMPLMLDSANPEALRRALMAHKGQAIINSASGDPRKLEKVLPLVAEHGCGVVALCLDEKGIPNSPQARLEVAGRILERAQGLGVKPGDVYIDPLVLTIATDAKAAMVCLQTLRLIRESFPQVHTIGGISNVSFGLPCRSLLNATFLAMAMGLGMDTLLINVRDKAVMATLWAANALAGNDPYCRSYLKAYRAGQLRV